MRRFLGKVFKWIGVLTVCLVALLVIVALSSDESLPDKMLLELDFRRGVVEHIPDHPLAEFRGSRKLSLREQVRSLTDAATDDRVVGIFARLGSARMSLAHVQEVSDAISIVRASGKPTVVFAETIGGLVPANGSYLLASAFEQINLQPSGSVGLVGLAVEHPFIKSMLDSLGIVASFGSREEYKNAPNLFTETGFTEEHLEATRSLMSDQFDQLVGGVAKGRGVDRSVVLEWINRGPHSAQSALGSGLVDELAYSDQVDAALLALTGQAERVKLSEYASLQEDESGEKIAVIYGVGSIGSGSSRYDPVSESQTVGSDTVIDAIKAASDDEGVRAILLRIDSPGGSYVASDAIWHATRRAQEKGIPVVVSMSSAAASGGYLVSTHADRVVAQPGTITGSIGVWAGKFVLRDFWSKFGVAWDEVYFGKNAALGSSLAEFSEEERALFDQELDRVYDAFVNQVAEGRNFDRSTALGAAKGRVWTGRQAMEMGLVDALGGFAASIKVIRELLELPPDDRLDLTVFPKRKDLADRILSGDWDGLSLSNELGSSVHVAHWTLRAIHQSFSGPLAWSPWLGSVRY